MSFRNKVTEIAQKLYPEIFFDTSELTEAEKINIGDSCSSTMCKRWQEQCQFLPDTELIPEAVVAGNSPIDLLDTKNGIAYELKYSHKNVKHEFYKDMFKILVYNDIPENKKKINTFVFLCHMKGISSLEASSLCQKSMQFMKKQGIDIHFVELYPDIAIERRSA